MSADMDARELERYSRQLNLPGWGKPGQEKLKAATVFVAGAGGLGSPACLYLAAAGVGRLVIADHDKVEMSNLNRQVLHNDGRLNSPKAASAAATIRALNPQVEVVAMGEEITNGNVDRLAAGASILLDCLDDFPSRYVLNRCALRMRVPMVHAAISGMEGHLLFIRPGETACLRCVFRDGPSRGVFPVLGAVPGVMGSMEALEALKYLTGTGGPQGGSMLIFDGATGEFRRMTVARDPKCPDCGVGGPTFRVSEGGNPAGPS